jgi:predicted nucleic acid-binding Zn ribbon protein
MSGPRRGGPRPLSDILGSLVSARGLGRLRGQAELEAAWEAAVGEPASRQTKPGAIKRGVLSVTVAHPALLEELSAFRKSEILAALRQTPAGAAVHDIRFRIGPID